MTPDDVRRLKAIVDAKHQAATSKLKAKQAEMAAIAQKIDRLGNVNRDQGHSASNPTELVAISLWQRGLSPRRLESEGQINDLAVQLDKLISAARNTHGQTEAVKSLEYQQKEATRRSERKG